MSATPPVSDLTSHLGYWLRYVSNHVSQAFARKLEDCGVTVAEWTVLREMFDEDIISPTRLSEKLGLTRGAISKLSERLVAKNLILRRPNPQDGRAQVLALTEQGRSLVPGLAELADRNDAEFFGHLGDAERKSVESILRDIVIARGLKSIPID